MAESSLLERNQDVVEVNRSAWKLIATILIPAIVAMGASYLFLTGHFIWCSVLILVFINLAALQTFLLKNSGQVWLAICLSTAGLLVPFYSVSVADLAIAALVILFFFMTGAFSGRSELKNTLKISFSKVNRKVMVGIITGIAGGLTVLAVSGALGPSVLSVNNIAKYAVDPYVVAPVVQYSMHQPYVPNETALKFFTDEVLAASSSTSESSAAFNSLPSKVRAQVINSAVASSVSQLESNMGISIDLNNSLAANIVQISEQKIGQLGQTTQSIIIISLYLILWSVVAFVAVILSYILVVSAFLIFELLIMTKFAEIQMESRSHEIVTLQ